MKVKIQTPIWTGNICSRSPTLRNTGILGSLRWWTESLLRGINIRVCDPTSKENCPGDKEIKYYCPACLIFGATGLSKSFKLGIDRKCNPVFEEYPINIKPKRFKKNRHGWYLGSGLVGEFEISFLPIVPSFKQALVEIPLAIASKWGGIGAKTQLGYGVFKLDEYSTDTNIQRFSNALRSIKDRLEFVQNTDLRDYIPNSEKYPNIQNFFFTKIQFKAPESWWKKVDGIKSRKGYSGHINNKNIKEWVKTGSVPIAPTIKNWMRFGKLTKNKKGKNILVSPYKEIYHWKISNWVFGDLREKIASKINISSAYQIANNWEFRIWGWIPEHPKFDRNGFLNSLKMGLKNSKNKTKIPWNNLLGKEVREIKLISWRQFNSANDTEKKENDIHKYINSLLEEG